MSGIGIGIGSGIGTGTNGVDIPDLADALEVIVHFLAFRASCAFSTALVDTLAIGVFLPIGASTLPSSRVELASCASVAKFTAHFATFYILTHLQAR